MTISPDDAAAIIFLILLGTPICVAVCIWKFVDTQNEKEQPTGTQNSTM